MAMMGRDLTRKQIENFLSVSWERQQSGNHGPVRRWWVEQENRLNREQYETIISLLTYNRLIQCRCNGASGRLIETPENAMQQLEANKIKVDCPYCKRQVSIFFDGEATPFCSTTCQQLHQKQATNYMKREARRVNYHLVRAISSGLPATLTLEQWLQTLSDFGGMCAYCHTQPFSELDHFIPATMGGGTTTDNCVPVCSSCNSIKGYKSPQNAYTLADLCNTHLDIEGVRKYLATKDAQGHGSLTTP